MTVRHLDITGVKTHRGSSVQDEWYGKGSSTGLRRRITKKLKRLKFTATLDQRGVFALAISRRARTDSTCAEDCVVLNLRQFRSLEAFIYRADVSPRSRGRLFRGHKNTEHTEFSFRVPGSDRSTRAFYTAKTIEGAAFEIYTKTPGATSLAILERNGGPTSPSQIRMNLTEMRALLQFADHLLIETK